MLAKAVCEWLSSDGEGPSNFGQFRRSRLPSASCTVRGPLHKAVTAHLGANATDVRSDSLLRQVFADQAAQPCTVFEVHIYKLKGESLTMGSTRERVCPDRAYTWSQAD